MIFEPVNYDDALYFLSTATFDDITQEFIKRMTPSQLTNIIVGSHFNFLDLYGVGSTFLVKDEDTRFIVAIAGAMPVIYGNIEWYSYTDVSLEPYKFAKSMMWYFDYLTSVKRVVRIQSTVVKDNKKAYNLHRKLGFIVEGVLRKYDGKNNYYMMAYIK